MAFVLVDDEYYKINLNIVDDFIGDDYDNFIENGPTDDIKLITWKMEIYFKKLEDKENSIIERYINPIYKTMKKDIRTRFTNFKYKVCKGCFDGDIFCIIDAITIDLEKNISTKTITVKFICNETYKHITKIENINDRHIHRNSDDPDKFYNYLNQMRHIIKIILNSKLCCDYDLQKYNTARKISMNKDIINNNKVLWFKDIVKNHYNNILINIESYVLYCKVEHVEIDFKKITERLRFIKQYIKDNYDIEIV